MCDFIKRMFTAPGTGAMDAVMASMASNMGKQNELQDRVLQQQKDAAAAAAAAMTPVADSESARQAAESRQRKLIAASPGRGAAKTGDAPLGYRFLMGE